MRYALVFLLLLSTLVPTSVDAVEAAEQPNIVHILTDELEWQEEVTPEKRY